MWQLYFLGKCCYSSPWGRFACNETSRLLKDTYHACCPSACEALEQAHRINIGDAYHLWQGRMSGVTLQQVHVRPQRDQVSLCSQPDDQGAT